MTSGVGIRRRLARLGSLLRYHKPSQFGWRLFRLAQNRASRRLPERWTFRSVDQPAEWRDGGREAFRSVARHRLQLWPKRAVHVRHAADGVFSYLNERRELKAETAQGSLRIDWDVDAPRLWRFHLQCQESLPEIAAESGSETAFALIRSWLDEPRHQSPLRDADAWHPFCISRRLPSWLSLLALHDPPESLRDRIWRSIRDQIGWLSRRLEVDLGGNHLLENLATLYVAGSFLDAGVSLEVMERRLMAQLDAQVLPTGEHIERTPTYHVLMLVAVLQCRDAARYTEANGQTQLDSVAARMSHFLRWIRLPHGEIPLLGDSALDETPDIDRVLVWADEGGVPSSGASPASNYWSSGNDRGDRLLFDTGPIACDELPAHGHADLTQVTASIGGINAIVDTGNFDYERGAMRVRCRSTSSHNVLQIDGREHADQWSAFRMGRRGRPLWTQEAEQETLCWRAVAHNAFPRAAGRVVLADERVWTIIDWYGHAEREAITRLHWHPEWKLDEDGPGNWTASHPRLDRRVFVRLLGEDTAGELRDAIYCPEFGKRVDNVALCNISRRSGRGWLGFQISLDGTPAESEIDFGESEMLIRLHPHRLVVVPYEV